MLELKKAQRSKAKIKMGIAAPSGGGKTLGALLIAYGIVKETYPNLSDEEIWSKVAIIDSENGSGELYVKKEIGGVVVGEYNAVSLTPPFEADKYTEAIKLCVKSGMEVVIIDSTSHLWAGQGGLLEQHGTISKRTNNSYAAWRDVTPQHNKFVDTMLQSDVHIIATMRSKTDYVQEKDPNTGKTTVRKVGLAPVQKDGMEYEFTIFLDVDAEHNCFASKDRTSVYDGKYFKITPDVGVSLMRWVNGGTNEAKQIVATAEEKPRIEKAKKVEEINIKSQVVSLATKLIKVKKSETRELIKKYSSDGDPRNIISETDLQSLKLELEKLEAE